MCPRSTERVPMEACVQSITPLRRPRNPCRLMLALRRTRAQLAAMTVAPPREQPRRPSTSALSQRNEPEHVAGAGRRSGPDARIRSNPRARPAYAGTSARTRSGTRRPHPLAGSARPPPPTLTKVTVPSSEQGSGLHGPFLPYSGRTSTGSWTAPGGAARPEDRALQRQAQRGATEAPCGLPGPPETPEEGLYHHFSGRIRLLSSMLAGYVATPERWLELFDLTAIPDTSLLVRGSLPQVHPTAGWRYPRGSAARYRH